MFRILKYPATLFLLVFMLAACVRETNQASEKSVLPSWNAGSVKNAILEFVKETTEQNSPNYLKSSERIAVFDNDGTLWTEQPVYFQLQFALDRIKAMAPEHPEWQHTQPYKSMLEGDTQAVLASGMHGLLEIVMASHAGMNTDEFEQIVKEWITTARYPKTNRLYKEMVFQPMLELLDYLRAHAFKTYIVSGGGIEFMRPWTEEVYGIPPEQVIGSTIKLRYEMRGETPVLVRLPEIDFINDKEGKPAGIYKYIGRRPVIAFGNSDGDLQMLQWTDANPKKSLKVLIHHTDTEREWAYDRESPIGHLDKALDEARDKNWLVVDMKNDWGILYPFELN
jgi:hypothetical protein